MSQEPQCYGDSIGGERDAESDSQGDCQHCTHRLDIIPLQKGKKKKKNSWIKGENDGEKNEKKKRNQEKKKIAMSWSLHTIT